MKKLLLLLLTLPLYSIAQDTLIFYDDANEYYKSFVDFPVKRTVVFNSEKYKGFGYFQLVNKNSVFKVARAEYLDYSKDELKKKNIILTTPEIYYKKAQTTTLVLTINNFSKLSDSEAIRVKKLGVPVPSSGVKDRLYIIIGRDIYSKASIIYWDVINAREETLELLKLQFLDYEKYNIQQK